MAVYRVLRSLDRGSRIIEPGQIIQIDWLSPENVGRLETVGAVAQVHGPPLVELPGWQLRSERLAGAGITTAVEFLEADSAEVEGRIEAQPGMVDKWKQDVQKWLLPPPPGKRRG